MFLASTVLWTGDNLRFLELNIRESRLPRVYTVDSGVTQLGFELHSAVYYHMTLRMSLNPSRPQCAHLWNGNKNTPFDVGGGN